MIFFLHKKKGETIQAFVSTVPTSKSNFMIFKLASVFKLRSDILAYSCKNKPYSSLIEAHLKLYDEDNLYSYVYLWFFLVHCIWILCQNYMYHELGSLHLARDSENTSCLSHFISTCSSGYEIMALKNFAYLQPDLVFKSRTSL